MKPVTIVSRRQALKAADARRLTNGCQKDKADAVCRHRFLGANLLLIEPEEGVPADGCYSDGGPTEVETSECEETKDMGPNCLWPCQFSSISTTARVV